MVILSAVHIIPYADGSTLAIQSGEVVTKSGYADFGGSTVNISDENPLKVVVPSLTGMVQNGLSHVKFHLM